MRHWLVTGASGFIGGHFIEHALAYGDTVTALTRKIKPDYRKDVYWVTDLEQVKGPISHVLNLAGSPIAEKRWTPARKSEIRASRIGITRQLSHFLDNHNIKPELIISASAIGYYGYKNQQVDEAHPAGTGFAAELCHDWEQALGAQSCRTVALRIGLVLGNGGIVAKLRPIFKAYLGGPIGNGKQAMSWIHIHDLIQLIEFCCVNTSLQGPVNATAPNPVSNQVFSNALAQSLNRPTAVTTPSLAMKLLFGQMAKELLLGGQFVHPHKALAHGFSFDFTDIDKALTAIN